MEKSYKEERIRKITHLYYSRPEIQKAIYDFAKNREICPRYFEGFGKRPDVLEYKNEIFEFVKKGATSFHASEELWQNPLEIQTGMSEKELNNLRIGWDLILDIDSKYLDYSKIMAKIIIDMLKFHGVKNVGVKFSGSKGFHIIVPWKAFPNEINEIKTKDMFPELPRIITKYIMDKTNQKLIEEISNLTRPNKYIKDYEAPKEVMPDLVLVSPRHLFRMPYSLHEKTALASVVIDPEKIKDFEMKDAESTKVEVKNFMPDSKPDEAKELIMQALDWNKENNYETKEKVEGKFANYKPVTLKNLKDEHFPPSVQEILKGVRDGKKRALFVLINLFRSIGMEKEDLEKRIYEWNEKNETPLKKGYIVSQLVWSYRRKPIMPPNFNSDIYKGIGVKITEEEKRFKNPVTFVIKKNLGDKSNSKKENNKKTKQNKTKQKTKDKNNS